MPRNGCFNFGFLSVCCRLFVRQGLVDLSVDNLLNLPFRHPREEAVMINPESHEQVGHLFHTGEAKPNFVRIIKRDRVPINAPVAEGTTLGPDLLVPSVDHLEEWGILGLKEMLYPGGKHKKVSIPENSGHEAENG